MAITLKFNYALLRIPGFYGDQRWLIRADFITAVTKLLQEHSAL